MSIFLMILAGIVIVATALPALPCTRWWAQASGFPRPQLVGLGLLVLAALPITLEWGLAAAVVTGLLVLAIAIQLWRILPYTRLWRVQAQANDEAADAPKLSIMIANVQMENRDAAKVRHLIAVQAPDVVLLVEPNEWWSSQLASLETTYPHHVLRPQDNTYGMLLFSKLPLHETEVRELLNEGVPSIRTDLELTDGRRVRLYAVHPPPPMLGHAEDSVPRDAELILVAREVADSTMPTIVAGDLNDVAWSQTTRLFQRLSGLLDPRVGRGMFNSFHAGHVWMRWPLDHIFFSPAFHLRSLQRLPAIGSDHFPLAASIVFVPEDAGEHNPPAAADEEDERDAASRVTAAHRCDDDVTP
ncbi:MAG: endonuclease [Phycisphaerales bacterium]|nr:endonuclease [Phycisphaerales bacterium]